MAIPAWFWPPSGAGDRPAARGIALAQFGAGMVVADWVSPVLWPFSGGAFQSGITVSGLSYGFAGAVSDGASGAWAVTWDSNFRRITSGGVVSYTAGLVSPYTVSVGAAWCAGSGFALAASGTVYTSGGTSLASFPLPGRALVSSGTTMAVLMGASGVGLMNANTGATGFIAYPAGITSPTCAALASGNPLVLAGWSSAPLLSGMAAAALDPQDSTRMLAVGTGRVIEWLSPSGYADAWSQLQLVTGTATLTAMAWRPDGTQALAASPASGAVQVFSYTVGTIALAQTLSSISGACSVAVAGTSVNALVAQSGMSQVTPLTYAGSTWTTGAAVGGLAGIVAVAAYGASGAVAATSAGLQYLNLVGGTWSTGTTVALGFTPSTLAVDTYGQVYAAASGVVAMASGGSLLASGTWSGGTPSAIAVQQGQIALAIPTDGLIRMFGLSSSGALTQQSTTSISTNSTGLGLSNTTLFVMQSSGTALYGFSGAPYYLTPVKSGAVSFWNGSSWTTASQMGVGHVPSAIGLDASGGVWAGTLQNTLWHISSGGTTLSSGTLTTYSGQTQSVPLCPSAIFVSGGTYVATSIPGVLIQAA